MIKLMAREFTLTQMERNMLVSGNKTNKMATELKLGLMELSTQEHMWTERNMERENSFGRMDLDTKVSSMTTISMETESTNGLTEDSMMENG